LAKQPFPQESVELTWGLFEAVQAPLEVAHLSRSVSEAKGLPNADILFDRGIEEGRINVKMAQLEVHGIRNSHE
jgi:hypothetical protein